MIPDTLLGIAIIPNNGGELMLTQRENDFSIHLKAVRGELMNSRDHCSEQALAELGCAHIRVLYYCDADQLNNGCLFFTGGSHFENNIINLFYTGNNGL